MRGPSDVLDRETGRVRVLARQCRTCLFRRGNPCHLPPGRAEQVIGENLERDTLLTCHVTLPYGEYPCFGPAVCAGFWRRHWRDVLTGRLAYMIGIVRVEPPDRPGNG